MEKTKNRWIIAASAVGIHLSIGSVYAWSVFAKPIVSQLGWSFKEVQFTFSIAILFLGLSAAFLGHFVEKHGPRKSASLAALFFGLGIAGAGLAIYTHSLFLLYFCYGVLGGIGLGIGYISPVSTLVKWFPDRRGLATGLAIMGFGFAALIASPIIQKLIVAVGLANTFFILGLFYFTVIFLSSRYLAPPKPGWTPEDYRQVHKHSPEKKIKNDDWQLTANEAVKTRRFFWIWMMLFINVTCGIAIISVASPMGQEIVGLTAFQAAAMVGFIGLFNGAGRIAWAALSDYMGRPNTYTAFFVIQIVAFFILPKTSNSWLFQGLIFLTMTCYGGGFACIPAFIGDLFGTKQLAAIHGYTLTAWAAAGLAGPVFVAWVRESTGNYVSTLWVFMMLFTLALAISLFIRIDMRKVRNQQEKPATIFKKLVADTKERIFTSSTGELTQVLDFVESHAEKAGLPPGKIFRLTVAVEEAFTNIADYAYSEEAAINLVNYAYEDKGRLLIRVRESAESFELDLLDNGMSFNPLLIPPPELNRSLENTDLKGLGTHLLQKLPDEVSYERLEGQNKLTLIMDKR